LKRAAIESLWSQLLHLIDTGQHPKGKTAVTRTVQRVGRALRLVRTKSLKPGGQGIDLSALRAQAAWAVELLHVWRGAVAVIDEVLAALGPRPCRAAHASPRSFPHRPRATLLFSPPTCHVRQVDIVLHPLKSELNWPLGDKHGLDFAPRRWELPVHLLEALLLVSPHGLEPWSTTPPLSDL
jgi:hypothetical protein